MFMNLIVTLILLENYFKSLIKSKWNIYTYIQIFFYSFNKLYFNTHKLRCEIKILSTYQSLSELINGIIYMFYLLLKISIIYVSYKKVNNRKIFIINSWVSRTNVSFLLELIKIEN